MLGIGTAIAAVANVGSEWLKGRNAESKDAREMKHKLAMAKIDAQIKLVQTAQAHEQNWEIIALKQRLGTYMDELHHLTLIAVIVGSFVPQTQPFVADGIAILDSYPMWLKSLIGASFAVQFGIRPLAGMFGSSKKKRS